MLARPALAGTGPPAGKGSRHVSKQKKRDEGKQKKRAEGKRVSRDASAQSRGGVVFAGRLLTVRLQPVTHPDSSVILYEVVEHPDAVAIVAVRRDGAGDTAGSGEPLVALVRQPRPAIGKDTWEIPAGLVTQDEQGDVAAAARRELREETGYDCDTLTFLDRHYPSPGFSDEAITVYLATGLHEAPGKPPPDPMEITRLEWRPLDEAMRMCREGEIEDGKTVIGLWLARDALAT